MRRFDADMTDTCRRAKVCRVYTSAYARCDTARSREGPLQPAQQKAECVEGCVCGGRGGRGRGICVTFWGEINMKKTSFGLSPSVSVCVCVRGGMQTYVVHNGEEENAPKPLLRNKAAGNVVVAAYVFVCLGVCACAARRFPFPPRLLWGRGSSEGATRARACLCLCMPMPVAETTQSTKKTAVPTAEPGNTASCGKGKHKLKRRATPDGGRGRRGVGTLGTTPLSRTLRKRGQMEDSKQEQLTLRHSLFPRVNPLQLLWMIEECGGAEKGEEAAGGGVGG